METPGVDDDLKLVSDDEDTIESGLPPRTGLATFRTDSLEGRTSEESESDEARQRQRLQNFESERSDAESNRNLAFAFSPSRASYDQTHLSPQEGLFTLPSITEESLRVYEGQTEGAYADENQACTNEQFPAYEDPPCSSSAELHGLEIDRRPSETQSAPAPVDRRGRRMTKAEDHPRHSSLTDFCRMKGRNRRQSFLSTKSSPARPAMTAISVRTADSPRVNTVYEHPKARYMPSPPSKRPVKTAQTFQSDLGLYRMIWEELPESSSGDSSSTMLEQRGARNALVMPKNQYTDQCIAPTSIMERIQSKLTAWTCEKELSSEIPEDGHG